MHHGDRRNLTLQLVTTLFYILGVFSLEGWAADLSLHEGSLRNGGPGEAIFITCHSDARPTIPHFMNKFQGALQPRNELEEQHLVLPVNPASIPPRAWHYQPGPHWTNYVQEEFPVNGNEFKFFSRSLDTSNSTPRMPMSSGCMPLRGSAGILWQLICTVS